MLWEIRLSGDAKVLDLLAEATHGKDPAVLKKKEGYFLHSRVFVNIESMSDFQLASNNILMELNGAARLILGSINPIKISGGNYVDREHKKHIFALMGPILVLPDTSKASEAEVQKINFWLEASKSDPTIAKIISLFNNDLDWVNLYRIYEVIHDDVGGEKKLSALCGVSRGRLENFSRTACHPEATGIAARHGSLSSEPPKNPMLLEEAKEFIKAIVNCWITHKTQPS